MSFGFPEIADRVIMNVCRAVLAAIISLVAPVAAHAEGLCTAKETAIFNCELEKSISSLCQSTENGALTYRNGSDGNINLQISHSSGITKDIFYFSNARYAGGGEAHIRFSRQGYTYYLYDKTIKTEEGPTFFAGIVVYKGRKKISNRVCNNDASIREKAYQGIVREEYESIDVR
ncbi:hypothetical protein LJ656_07625 [Paraburkholderia sp. MMS20-SJTR3]|uniref:Uncharacterized protein n=1 Tax=Paraburkholderia sejongensis TaxID=2886946 RepID=A0ABS8JRT4_9BURK|nr:hypothetical protein [Paraburkholderia sp. MMS20-SJTR3]MCC8392454.1 hypothetical protein [Paraburkholderia sp. MMS20-SJTR3]